MLMAGKHVTQAGDQLNAVSVERMYKGIINTEGPIVALVQQLRALKTMQPDAYRKAKTQLPYVVCGYFSPPIRRTAHFAWIEHFIIDIDKLSSGNMSPDAIKRLLKADERVALLFTSPGNDGVKALFNLKNRIHDAGYYSLFYKRFAARLAVQYRLEGLIDLVTNDVSRCCFMSHDAEAWYNPNAIPVDADEYLDPNSLEGMKEAIDEVKQVEKTAQEKTAASNTELPASQSAQKTIGDDVLDKIKQKINPEWQKRQPKTKNHVQPNELNEAMPLLTEALAKIGMPIVEVKPISFGKQLKLKAGNLWAEINLFYGKAGFRAIQTTKTGSNAQLAELAVQAIQLHFEQLANEEIQTIDEGRPRTMDDRRWTMEGD